MRRKYSLPVWIDTPLELYQKLNILAPTTKLKIIYGNYTRCFFRTVDNFILLQLRNDFPLVSIIKANRPYTSLAQLCTILNEQMAEIIRLERIIARQLVGSSSITEAYNTLTIFQNKGFEINIFYSAYNSIIILAEYIILMPGATSPHRVLDNLTNNSALLYLKLEFLKDHLKSNPRLILSYLAPVDEILNEMQITYGSELFGKVHALQKIINFKP